jgi:serine/threonine protein kinase/serine/threonine protein phosphatase PrpC
VATVPRQLQLAIGQHTEKGRKESNQDFHGACFPAEPHLSTKGIAIALADGISSSAVSRAAAEAAVKSLVEDYYCTSETWSVKKSAHRVLFATNSWLYAQTQQSQYRYEKDRGYVCTLSALIFKSTTAHLFHIGDARVYRLHGDTLEQLTVDHRVWMSEEQSHLSRALGINPQVDIDYQSLQVEVGDVFVIATDGVYEYVDPHFTVGAIRQQPGNLDAAARAIVEEALRRESDDNLTIQIVRVESLPDGEIAEIYRQTSQLPLPPLLEARMHFDGYEVVRELHASSRSHLYLARDLLTQGSVVLKVPSIDQRGYSAYLERFLMEEWVARRLNSPHVLKPCAIERKRNYLYAVTEYIEGGTLAQWMADHPKPDIETVRGILEQIAKGLQAFHRLEMLHQDIRPQNIMIDSTGTVKLIDFGSTRVAGIAEISRTTEQAELLGTAQYAAPEYFVGESGTTRSDLYSLGVIAYQLFSGRLPYGAEVARCKTQTELYRLEYRSLLDEKRSIPAWIDDVLKKAVHLDPLKRYEELSEFVYDLRHPNSDYLSRTRQPLIERNPVAFWKSVSLILAVVVLVLLFKSTTQN